MVPEGWKRSNLGEHLEMLSGFAFKSSGYTSDQQGLKLLRGDNIEPGKLRWRDVKRWPQEDVSNYRRYELRAGDIVLAMDRTWVSSGLKVAEVTNEDLPCLLVQRVARLRALPTVEQSLLKQYFSSHRFEHYVKAVQTETAVPHISARQIKEFPFLLPPLYEQKKIAKILSTWDKAITTTQKLLANSQQQKKALMQKLLTGQKRLPGYDSKWKWLKSGEVFSPVSRRNNAATEPLLAVTQDDGILPRSFLERRVVMPEGSTQGYKLVRPGNFVISLRSFQGGLEYSEYRGLVSPAYTILEETKPIDHDFYRQYFKSYDFIGHLAVAVIGIRDGKQVSYNDFSFLRIPYPPIEEQRAISKTLVCAEKTIHALEKQLSKLRLEKNALMQQLLTGKRRISLEAA